MQFSLWSSINLGITCRKRNYYSYTALPAVSIPPSVVDPFHLTGLKGWPIYLQWWFTVISYGSLQKEIWGQRIDTALHNTSSTSELGQSSSGSMALSPQVSSGPSVRPLPLCNLLITAAPLREKSFVTPLANVGGAVAKGRGWESDVGGSGWYWLNPNE